MTVLLFVLCPMVVRDTFSNHEQVLSNLLDYATPTEAGTAPPDAAPLMETWTLFERLFE